jgi:hypothetical protein
MLLSGISASERKEMKWITANFADVGANFSCDQSLALNKRNESGPSRSTFRFDVAKKIRRQSMKAQSKHWIVVVLVRWDVVKEMKRFL